MNCFVYVLGKKKALIFFFTSDAINSKSVSACSSPKLSPNLPGTEVSQPASQRMWSLLIDMCRAYSV